MKGHPWKEELEDSVNIRVIGEYLHGFSEAFDIEPEIKFNTRVEQLDKLTGQTKWRVISTTLVSEGLDSGKKIRQEDVRFLVGTSAYLLTDCRILMLLSLRTAITTPARFQTFPGSENGKKHGHLGYNTQKAIGCPTNSKIRSTTRHKFEDLRLIIL